MTVVMVERAAGVANCKVTTETGLVHYQPMLRHVAEALGFDNLGFFEAVWWRNIGVWGISRRVPAPAWWVAHMSKGAPP